jgi:hypothetical protein
MATQPRGTAEVACLFREIDKDKSGALNEKELTVRSGALSCAKRSTW